MIAEGRSPFRLLHVKPRQPKKVAGAGNLFSEQTIFDACQFPALSGRRFRRVMECVDGVELQFAACALVASCLG